MWVILEQFIALSAEFLWFRILCFLLRASASDFWILRKKGVKGLAENLRVFNFSLQNTVQLHN